MKKTAEDSLSLEDTGLSGVSVMSDEQEAKTFPGISSEQGQMLSSALKIVSMGIDKGLSLDLASKKGPNSIFDDISEIIVSPLKMSLPARKLERSIKDSMKLTESNDTVNRSARDSFNKKIVVPSESLYNSNFKSFIDISKSSNIVSDEEKTDLSMVKSLIIEYNGADDSLAPLDSESPYKIILNKLIPILREKFDAITTFDKAIGSGQKIDYKTVSQSFMDGSQTEEDSKAISGLYKAINEWYAILEWLRGDKKMDLSSSSSSVSSKKTDDKPSKERAAEDIQISRVLPGQNVFLDINGSGELMVDTASLERGETPVVKILITGPEADKVNSSGSAYDYLSFFMQKGYVRFLGVRRATDIISNVSRENVLNGAELTIYLDPQGLLRAKSGSSEDPFRFMTVRSGDNDISVFADDRELYTLIRKYSSTETTPLYETSSPNGERVFFTPADLVIGRGKVRDSKGKSFKPKKIKSKSLADRVMSKDFGRVKRKKKRS